MQENQVTIEGDTFPLPSPFLAIATLNPVDVEGVYHLPEAQLDRFMLRTTMEYLDTETEQAMLAHNAAEASEAEVALTPEQVQQAQQSAREIAVADPVIAYIQTLGEATRQHEAVDLGASPRAMEQLMQAARAHALLESRDYVIPDDVQRVAANVLAHRLILDVDAEVEGRSEIGIVQQVLEDTPIPNGIDASADPTDPSPDEDVAIDKAEDPPLATDKHGSEDRLAPGRAVFEGEVIEIVEERSRRGGLT
jgi:MoxR-like ATPase